VGYQKGYCYSQGYGCISPIPPITPLPNVYENSNSYTDGYNRGFTDGQNANQNKSNNNPLVNNNSPFPGQSSYGSVKPEFGQMNLYTPDYEHLNNVYNVAQDRYNNAQANTQGSNQQKLQNDISNQTIISIEKWKEYNKISNIEIRKLRIEKIKSEYNSCKSYPTSILNGIYDAVIIMKSNSSNNEFYESCKVRVVGNKIVAIHYTDYYGFECDFIMDGYFPSNFYLPAFQQRILSADILNGKSVISTKLYNSALNTLEMSGYEILLLDYISFYNKTQKNISNIRNKTANNKLSNVTGWFKGYLSDRNILCEERDFYIENGVVKKWIGKNGYELKVDSGGKIMEGRTSVSIFRPPVFENLPNSPLGKSSYQIYDIYFVM
jgi:hypothetical protein